MADETVKESMRLLVTLYDPTCLPDAAALMSKIEREPGPLFGIPTPSHRLWGASLDAGPLTLEHMATAAHMFPAGPKEVLCLSEEQ